jgi:hypothetical protein
MSLAVLGGDALSAKMLCTIANCMLFDCRKARAAVNGHDEADIVVPHDRQLRARPANRRHTLCHDFLQHTVRWRRQQSFLTALPNTEKELQELGRGSFKDSRFDALLSQSDQQSKAISI